MHLLFHPFLLAVAILFSSRFAASGATIVGADLVITATSVSMGTTDPPDSDPSPNIDERELINNRGNVGTVTSTASDLTLVSLPNPEDFIVTGDTLSANVERTRNPGRPVDASSTSSFQISFTLDPGETGTLELDFAYSLLSLGISAPVELNWTLTGPDPNVATFEGNLVTTNSTELTGSISQSNTLSTAGSYTFSVTTLVPLQAFSNVSSGNSSLSGFSLAFSSVPEPSTALLTSLALASLLRQRKRSQ